MVANVTNSGKLSKNMSESKIISPIPKESGHWYDAQTGEPRYTTPDRAGNPRPTTLRDARKLNLVPSVTSICRILDKPGLANWIADQLIMASLTLPRIAAESDSDYIARIKLDSNQRRDMAAARGTALHTDIECYIQGKSHGHEAHIANLSTTLAEHGIELRRGKAEHSFAHPDGFGGKLDWHLDNVFLDFKSKDRIEDGKRLAWDEHSMQLAAYAHGLGIPSPRGINVFIGVDDCRVVVVEHDPGDMARGLAMFKLLLSLWKLKNNVV